MCGIAGLLGTCADRARAESMAARLSHRGPDDGGTFADAGVALAHTRLAVIDPTPAGRQPMESPDRRYALVYNGEVYNFRRLRSELRGRGHAFRSEGDTEVVLHAWMEWGPSALERLDGMFACAVWDRADRVLHLARDRLGIKPLYSRYDGGGGFLFASEVRALLASGLVPRMLDTGALRAFLSQQTVPTPRTLLAEVRMLPPGSHLRVRLEDGRAAAPELGSYWKPLEGGESRREEIRGGDRAAWLEGLRERLAAAVERRLVTDVPLGAFLSGGIDSTAIVGLMARASASPVRTFTVAFDEPGYDDGPFARQVADRFATEHTEVRLGEDELVAGVPAAVADQDHPSGDGINTWLVSRAARRAGLTVALSGLGADELFGGYPTFGRLAALGRAEPLLRRIPRPARAAAGRLARTVAPGVHAEKLAALLATDGSVAQGYPVLRSVFPPWQVDRLVRREPPGRRAKGNAPEMAFPGWPRGWLEDRARPSVLREAALAELTCYMRDVLLRDADQMSMAHSLEVRVPFLDRDVVEYALALPDEARRPSDPPKRFLVEALGDLVPPGVAARAKSGFAMPFDRWMRGPLRSFCEEGIQAAAAHPAFDEDEVRGVWRGFLGRDPRLTWSRPWLVVALGHWLEREGVGGVA